MFQIYEKCCKNCLLSEDRIVSPERADEMVKSCIDQDTHFVCHKSSMYGGNVCCSAFYHKYKTTVNLLVTVAKYGLAEFVEHEDNERLMSYKEMYDE